VGETAVPTQTDKVTMAKTGEADKRGAPIVTERAAAEAVLTLSQLENQPRGHGKEREVHTISSDEPPWPHGKTVMDVEMSSTMEMAPWVRRKGQR
jgi:hypothetical protein